MVAKAPKARITQEERTLKKVGQSKFELAQDLTAGRDFLDAVSGRDSTSRNAEKIRAEQAVQLGRIDLADSAKVRGVDARTAAKTGVAARATSDENAAAASGAIIEADLGISSSVDASLRSSAQSKVQLQEAELRAQVAKRNNLLDVAGTVVGGIATSAASGAFSTDIDPLANPNQAVPELDNAILTNPNNRAGFMDPFAQDSSLLRRMS